MIRLEDVFGCLGSSSSDPGFKLFVALIGAFGVQGL